MSLLQFLPGLEEATVSKAAVSCATREHVTKATATITDNGLDNPFSVNMHGTTSGVSSGSPWGYGFAADSREEAIEKIMRFVNEHNVWCDSWRDAEKDIVYRKGEKYKTELTIDGKPVILSMPGQGLQKFGGAV